MACLTTLLGNSGVLKAESAATMSTMTILKISSLILGIMSAETVIAEIRLDLTELPAGFNVEIHAGGVKNARHYEAIKSLLDQPAKSVVITDGALLVSDDVSDNIYPINYE